MKECAFEGRFDGKVAIVTGGSSGIGEATACRLGAEGATVVIAARGAQRGREVAARIIDFGGKAVFLPTDMRDAASCRGMVEEAARMFERIDVLVNNAAVSIPYPFLETSLELWQEMMDTNLTGTFICSQATAKYMAMRGSGRIINISSQVAIMGNTERAAYSASKGGVLSLTRSMAVELAQFGITVNAIVPGAVTTPMTETNHSEARRSAWTDAIPMRRYGNPTEVAGVILFLASQDASYITGQTLPVDGGFSIRGLVMNSIQRGAAKGMS